jgi:TonB-linked SusC/RagA family outer membrane protein
MKKCLLTCFMFALALWTFAQERTVSGRVTSNEDGTPLPGVNVVLKGTTTGTSTDSDGKYSLAAPASGGALIFSFIGLESKEVEIGDRTIIDVSLALDVTQLTEVVVTALNIAVDKDRLGTASSKITGDASKRSGEPTLINGLQGKASGVNIVRTSGDPGAGSYIQIRGQSSITRSVQPLVVIDGVPSFNSGGGNTGSVVQQSRLNDINPNDIASVEILKGAAASALFGTRAANGVIMITTKTGSSAKGKVNISYGGTYSQDKILVEHPMQTRWGQGNFGIYGGPLSNTANSFGDFIASRAGGADVTLKPGDPGYRGYFKADDGTEYYQVVEGTITNPHGGKNDKTIYDRYDQLFKTGSYFEHNLSISSGNENGGVFASMSNLDQTGIIRGNSDYKRTTLRLNINQKLTDFLKIKTNFTYAHLSSSRIQQGSNVNGLFLAGLRAATDFDSRDWKGTFYDAAGTAFVGRQRAYRNHIGFLPTSSAALAYDNALWVTNENIDESTVDRFNGIMQFDIKATDWLSVTLRNGMDHYSDKRKTFFPVNSAGAVASGQLTLQTPRETQWNFDGFATGTWKLGNNFNLASTVGINFNQQSSDNVGATTSTFTIQVDPPENVQNAVAANRAPFNSLAVVRRSAGYFTIDTDFKEEVFLNVTGRGERSSTFSHADNPLFFYPSVSAAWQFTKTLSLENQLLSFGKLRASWGQVGNSPGTYSTFTYYNGSVYGETWGSTLNTSGYGGGYERSSLLGNKDLKPETKTEIEFGGDFRFLNNRIELGATYFTNTISDVLLNISVAPSIGYTTKAGNVAELQNKGIEIDLSGDVFVKGDFTWNLYGNWTKIENKVTDLAGTSSIFLAGFTGTSSRAVKGQPIGVLWGTSYARDAEGGLVLDTRGFPTAATTEGVLGNPNPEWRGGLGSRFSWKGLSLNVLFEHSHGGVIWGGTRGALFAFGTHKDTDKMVTLSAAEAATLLNYSGNTVVAQGYPANSDGTYTIRGEVKDFGNGPVLLDQQWWSSLGGGFGTQAEDFIESAQWTKLREVSLSYRLNSAGFKQATKLSSIDFTIAGRNLMLWTDFKGNDPETNLTGPTNGRGLDYFNNPATKSMVFSVVINY